MKGIAGMNTMKMTTGGGGGGGGGGGKISLKKYASVLLTYHFPLNCPDFLSKLLIRP